MQTAHQLEPWNYNQFFETSRVKLGADIDCVARVIAEHKGAYDIVLPSGQYRAAVEGKLMLRATRREDYPAVGDWVVVKASADDAKVIEHILPRKTLLRKRYGGKDEAQLIATNVDVVFIVESVDRDYSLNRFERYIVLSREGGAEPIIVLNKSDLLTESELSLMTKELRERFPDIEILRTSTLTDMGLDEIRSRIEQGGTFCFLGSSGVGKSSIINKLLGQVRIETQEIGTKTGRGRHTTTARQMYLMEQGGVIIDNPGSRAVGLVDFGTGAEEVFTAIEALALQCKFTDCNHINVAGCAVIEALKSGDIERGQYENFIKLQKETEHYQMTRYDKRQKDKKFGKYIKSAKADLKRFNSD